MHEETFQQPLRLLATFELGAVTLTRGLRRKVVKERTKVVKEVNSAPPPSTWKVPPSPSRLVAKSGVWIAVAANILCTLLPSGSWPNWTIWAQGIEFKFINKYCDLSRADIIVQGNDLAEYLSLTLRLPHGRPKGRNPSQNRPLLLCCNCVH